MAGHGKRITATSLLLLLPLVPLVLFAAARAAGALFGMGPPSAEESAPRRAAPRARV